MTDGATNIPVEDLRKVFDLLLRHVGHDSSGKIGVESDFFWSVASDELTKVYEQPRDLTIGQVSESWLNLSEMLEDNSKIVGYGLVWLADVLRAIGVERIG